MKRNWLLTIAWLLGRYILMEMERYGTSQLESTVFLRFVSRLAIAFRVTRVIINLRKARKLSGFFTKSIQIAVSQNRRRYTKSGFNLDLNYITDRVIAMSAPCFGAHTSYRNDIHVVFFSFISVQMKEPTKQVFWILTCLFLFRTSMYFEFIY